MLKQIIVLLVSVLIFVSLYQVTVYIKDMRHAYQRVEGNSKILPSPFGDIEYVDRGSGVPVLIIHGAGGGYDQGELIAGTVLDEGFRWIIPSRFGYLGSDLPEGASWDEQAEAYSFLLDHLGIEEVAVVAMSQGGSSALLFSLLYPERVSSLTCISCGIAHSKKADQALADRKGYYLKVIFKYDSAYWFISKYFRRQLMSLIGAGEEVIDSLTPQQRESMDQLIEYMNPASLRTMGVVFDNSADLPGNRISGIGVPTLIFHARDDGLQLYHNAEFAASEIPGSSLISFDSGGHVLLIVEQTVISNMLQLHILDHATDRDEE